MKVSEAAGVGGARSEGWAELRRAGADQRVGAAGERVGAGEGEAARRSPTPTHRLQST